MHHNAERQNLKQNESDFCTIQGFCSSNMILSAYMYRKEYSGFLRKVGKLPRYLNEILHQFGANVTVLMSLMCPNSVKRANCRRKQIFRCFILMLHIGIACATDTTIFRYNYVPSAITKPTHKMSRANCNQDLLKDVFFVLDISDIEDVHDVTNSNYVNLKPQNLKASDVKSRSTPKKVTPYIVKPSKLPPGFQIFLNENDNLGNHEYCLVVDT